MCVQMLHFLLPHTSCINDHTETVRATLSYRNFIGLGQNLSEHQRIVGHSRRRSWLERLSPNPVERLIFEAEGIDVRIFPNVEPVS